MVLSLPLLSCESSVSVKENPDRKKKKIYAKQLTISESSFKIKAMSAWALFSKS